jgi:hypothetical protein
MAITITSVRVNEILGETTLDATTITANIAGTVLFLTELFSGVTITDALLNEVGAFYAAHICRLTEREIKLQDFNGSKSEFKFDEGSFLDVAAEIDATGTLTNYLKKKKNPNSVFVGVGY